MRWAAALGMSLVLAGCVMSPELLPIDSVILAEVRPVSPGAPSGSMMLALYSQRDYPSPAYRIATRVRHRGLVPDVHVLGVRGLSGGWTAELQRAFAEIPLGAYSPGRYPITVRAHDEVVTVSVVASTDSLRIEGPDGVWVRFPERNISLH